MYTLTESEAILLVRRNIDEQEYNDSSMAIVDDKDSTAFEELCKKLLPEAINEVHANAPLNLLDGEDGANSLTRMSVLNEVFSFTVEDVVLRLIAFQLGLGSNHPAVYEMIAEASPVGRMQLNPYTRGTVESPKLILREGGQGESNFRYYTTTEITSEHVKAYEGASGNLVDRFEYLPMYRYDTTGVTTSYKIAERVHNNIIDQLTAKVLAVYNSAQATYFFTRAGFGSTQESTSNK